MSTLSSKDRASLCAFTFADGRRCRTPRSSNHPHLCFYHARKEAQAKAAKTITEDISFFFSGEYISACDLSLALDRLFKAVAKGELKPRTASTLAYLAQTLVQAIHLSQHEFINPFDTNSWRATVRGSVKSNLKSRFPKPAPPPAAAPPPPQPTTETSPQPAVASLQQPPAAHAS